MDHPFLGMDYEKKRIFYGTLENILLIYSKTKTFGRS